MLVEDVPARVRGRGVDRAALALGGLVIAAAALRLAALTGQSYWFDEVVFTAVPLKASFWDMLSQVRAHQSEPPLYFVAAWPWARVFGESEAGLRSLSAVFGVLTVPVAYAIGRTLVDRRVGLVVAALVTVSPVMIWYSVEARAYALFVLLCGLSMLFFVRALESAGSRDLLGWSVASGLAVVTHYFAAFLVIPEAVWLLARGRGRRRALYATLGIGAAGLAIAPLALYQRDHGGGETISITPLSDRVRDAAHVFVTAGGGPAPWLMAGMAILIGGALVLVWRVGTPRARLGATVAAVVAGGALAIPVIAAKAGSDYVLDRNLLAAWIPLAVVPAAAVAVRRWRLLGWAIPLVLCGVFLAADYRIATRDELRRDDWRGVADRIGRARDARVVVVAPGWQVGPFAWYEPCLRPLYAGRPVQEVVTIVFSRPGWGRDAPPQPPPGPRFRVVEDTVVQRMHVLRYRAPSPERVEPAALNTGGPNGSRAFVEPRERARPAPGHACPTKTA